MSTAMQGSSREWPQPWLASSWEDCKCPSPFRVHSSCTLRMGWLRQRCRSSSPTQSLLLEPVTGCWLCRCLGWRLRLLAHSGWHWLDEPPLLFPYVYKRCNRWVPWNQIEPKPQSPIWVGSLGGRGVDDLLEFQNRLNWAKDLFLSNQHVFIDIGENSGLNVVPLWPKPVSSCFKLGSTLDTWSYVSHHLLKLLWVDLRNSWILTSARIIFKNLSIFPNSTRIISARFIQALHSKRWLLQIPEMAEIQTR